MTAGILGFVSRWALLVIAAWAASAGAANVVIPQLEHVVAHHSRSFFPADSGATRAAVHMGAVFGDSDSNNLAYVVLEADHPLAAPDHAFYPTLVSTLRADTSHVQSMMDLWSEPLATSLIESRDHRAAYLLVRLSGQLGSSSATDSVAALRAAVAGVAAPPGLRVYVTGPGVSLVDEFGTLDRQLAKITALTVVLIAVLLLIVYRSPITAALPLISVGLSLGVARPLVAVLGEHGLIEVSVFSVSLMSAMVLGAGTDYAIFLLGRYHESRRAGIDPDAALAAAFRSVAPVIVGSSATIAAALFCLGLTKVSFLRSAGIPSAVGILVAMAASLTVMPALIGWAGRRGRAEPRRSTMMRRWRRVGAAVARWPGPIVVTAGAALVVCTLPLLGTRISFAELAAQPASTASSRGYQAMDRHFPDDRLLPEIVLIQSDHDMRNPAGLIAIERISRQIMAIHGVRMVQSATRPAGAQLQQSALTYQAGQIGDQLGGSADSMQSGLASVDSTQSTLEALGASVDQLEQGLSGAVAGLHQVSGGGDDIGVGMRGLGDNLNSVSRYLDPLRGFVNSTADCSANPICSPIQKLVAPVDDAIAATNQLASGATKLTDGTARTAAALGGASASVADMRASLTQLHKLIDSVRATVGAISPQLRQMTEYLTEMRADFDRSADGGFYLPPRTFDDPRYRRVVDGLFSPDGHATRVLVYGDADSWGDNGARRSAEIRTAATEALKEGTLVFGTTVDLNGVGTSTAELKEYLKHDFALLAIVALTLIFLIVTAMLRSPVAGIAVLATVTLSYASALGASVLIWQHLLGHPLHWAVPALAFIALVAVGADYNLLLTMRLREEAHAGMKTGVIRAFGGTGGVVTTAGIVFGITMFALLAGDVITIAQVGSTIGVGLLIDTLVVRTFVVPGIAVLLGRWFWWPRRITARPTPGRHTARGGESRDSRGGELRDGQPLKPGEIRDR